MQIVLDFLIDSWNSLTTSFILKTILSSVAALAIWVIGLKHVQILGVFILLVFVDLLTKWASIAYKMLVDEYMRKGFIGKVMTYVAATIAAILFDEMSGQRQFAVSLVWLYLGSSEFLSILENLRDGGNVSMGKFLDLIRTKIENKVKL